MTRKEGFIEIDKILEEIGVDTTNVDSILNNPCINEICYIQDAYILFSFDYHDETYFFKSNFYPNCSPYNELVGEELAKDYGISCANYDLAVLGNYKGVLSKNFKLENMDYIYGSEILKEYEQNTGHLIFNSLEDIWAALEYRYQDNLNKREIVSHLMKKIVDIYLFDIILCHCDRHSKNWEIMESDNNIDIAPLYDNERILTYGGANDDADISLVIDSDSWGNYENLWKSIRLFQKISSSEFTDIIKDKLWIISEENLYKVFDRIEKKTGYPMPEERKEFYLSNYQEHKRRLEEVLEKEKTRKR